MNRISKVTLTMTASLILSVNAAYSASFGDVFGGKKAQEYKVMIEQKEAECQVKLDEKDRLCQQLNEDSKGAKVMVQGLREKNATLMENYEKMKGEQENTLEQLKRLRQDSLTCSDIRKSYDQMTKENQAFIDEKESVLKKSKQASTTVENLKMHLKEVTAEKDQLAVFLAEAQEDEDVKVKKIREQVQDEVENLKKQVALLTEENSSVAKQLEESQKQLRMSKNDGMSLGKEKDLLKAELTAFEKRQEDLKKENVYLAKEATQFPQKFADLARHNRKLVTETADMHYNLGVSNIKNKDYKRAVKEFEKVLELKPDDAYANYNLGYIYAEHLVDREKAIAYFQKYLTYAPDEKDANWVRKYVLTWQTWYKKNIVK
jgi:tetratricopeptide (TPR) repeat protein